MIMIIVIIIISFEHFIKCIHYSLTVVCFCLSVYLFVYFRVAPLNPALSFLNSIVYRFGDEPSGDGTHKICLEHDHEELKPQLISTWMPNGVGAMPGKRVIFAETQVRFQHTTTPSRHTDNVLIVDLHY